MATTAATLPTPLLIVIGYVYMELLFPQSEWELNLSTFGMQLKVDFMRVDFMKSCSRKS